MLNRIRTLGPLLAAVFTVAACGQPTIPTQTQPSGVSVSQPGSSGGGQSTGNGAATEVTTETVTGPVTRLEISTDYGRISVTGTDDDAVTVTRSIYRDPVAPTETVRHEGDLLHIESECPDAVPSRPCRIDYEVSVPRGTEVEIGSASGDVGTDGLTAPQTVGSVSGDVRVTGAGGDTVTASSTSGDLELELAVAPRRLAAESVSGSVTVTVPAGSYRVDADTVSGDIDVDVPTDPSAASDLRLNSTSGDIEVRAG
jgi:hypothetical protein